MIGIPFYLADRRLARIEEEQTGEVEDDKTVMMFLRHEAGHAVNYAYRLWRQPDWVRLFGAFTKPYREEFRPDKFSRRFVRHIEAYRDGRTYEGFLGKRGLERMGKKSWRRLVGEIVPRLHAAFQVDEVVLGGGNVKLLKARPPACRLGSNAHAFVGGLRLWEPAGVRRRRAALVVPRMKARKVAA